MSDNMGQAFMVHYPGADAEDQAPTVYVPDPDPDGSVGGLAMALDAQIDAAQEALISGNPAQADALLTGAGATSDALLEALGCPDADDPDVS